MSSQVKRLWRWFVHNVTDVGESEPIPIELERNREAVVEMGAENPPDVPLYRFLLGLRAGFSGDQRAAVPVFRRVNESPHPVLKEIYYCEVAGSTLEAANIHALRSKVSRMLEALAPAGSLPLAYFRVPSADYSLPIYEQGGRITCPMLAGADLKANDLAEMRRNVLRYLRNAGYVTEYDQVELRVVRPSDLRLVAPAAIIRSLDDPELWFATVEGHSDEGLVIGLLGEATELRPERRRHTGIQDLESPPAASDVASLLRLVANELFEARRLDNPYALYAMRVRPEIWARTEGLTDDLHRKLVCWLEGDEPTRLELPLRHTTAGELMTALADDGISVFAAPEEPLLTELVGRYLAGSGFLRFEEAVEVVGDQPAIEGPVEGFAGREIEFARLDSGGAQPGSEVSERNEGASPPSIPPHAGASAYGGRVTEEEQQEVTL